MWIRRFTILLVCFSFNYLLLVFYSHMLVACSVIFKHYCVDLPNNMIFRLIYPYYYSLPEAATDHAKFTLLSLIQNTIGFYQLMHQSWFFPYSAPVVCLSVFYRYYFISAIFKHLSLCSRDLLRRSIKHCIHTTRKMKIWIFCWRLVWTTTPNQRRSAN